MVYVEVAFANKDYRDVYQFSRVPCDGEDVYVAGRTFTVIEVIHMANVDPTNQAVARILVS